MDGLIGYYVELDLNAMTQWDKDFMGLSQDEGGRQDAVDKGREEHVSIIKIVNYVTYSTKEGSYWNGTGLSQE